MLLVIYLKRDRRRINRCTELHVPQLVPRRGIQHDKIAVGIPGKYHTARRGQSAAVWVRKIRKCPFYDASQPRSRRKRTCSNTASSISSQITGNSVDSVDVA